MRSFFPVDSVFLSPNLEQLQVWFMAHFLQFLIHSSYSFPLSFHSVFTVFTYLFFPIPVSPSDIPLPHKVNDKLSNTQHGSSSSIDSHNLEVIMKSLGHIVYFYSCLFIYCFILRYLAICCNEWTKIRDWFLFSFLLFYVCMYICICTRSQNLAFNYLPSSIYILFKNGNLWFDNYLTIHKNLITKSV